MMMMMMMMRNDRIMNCLNLKCVFFPGYQESEMAGGMVAHVTLNGRWVQEASGGAGSPKVKGRQAEGFIAIAEESDEWQATMKTRMVENVQLRNQGGVLKSKVDSRTAQVNRSTAWKKKLNRSTAWEVEQSAPA